MKTKEMLNYLGMIFLGVLLFVGGFYFGYKYNAGKTVSTTSGIVAGVEDIKKSADSVTNVQVQAKEVEGLLWIKAGEEPICPNTHPIKGKVDGTIGYYYNKTNKSYDRVKPIVCFATEEYAEKSAGFVKKF